MAPALSKYLTRRSAASAAAVAALIWLISRKRNKKRLAKPR
jgi:hypothetical protein